MTPFPKRVSVLLLVSLAFIVGAFLFWRHRHAIGAATFADRGHGFSGAGEPAAFGSDETARDLASLQGEWLLVSGSSFGEPVPGAGPSVRKLVKGTEVLTFTKEQRITREKFTLDASKRPKWIDLEIFTTAPRKYTNHAIYELEGDRLTLGHTSLAADADRPATFPNGDGVLLIYERQKPDRRK